MCFMLTVSAAYVATVPEQIAPELKNQDFSQADIAKVVDLLDQYDLTARTFVQSFTPGVLARVHDVRPGLPTVLASRTPPSVSAIRGSGSTRVAVDMVGLTATQVALYKRHGLKVWGFTALNRAGLVTAHSLGVSAVVTDVPRQARNYY